MSLHIHFTPAEHHAVQRIATQKLGQWVEAEREELVQELYLKLCVQYKHVELWRDDQYGSQKLALTLARAADKNCKKQTEQKLHIDIDHENQVVDRKAIPDALRLMFGTVGEPRGHVNLADTYQLTNEVGEVSDILIPGVHAAMSREETVNVAYELLDFLWEEYNKFSDTKKSILRGLYQDEKTMDEVADSLGLTRISVGRYRSSAEKTLWQKLGRKYKGKVG